MRSWNLPRPPRAMVFDLDSTLYTNASYARFQNEVLISRLARERGQSVEATGALLEGLRAERKRRGEGDTSLGNLFLALGIPIETSVAWREELIRPSEWLSADPLLDRALEELSLRCPLCLVTNNPRSVGRASLEALGVARHFSFVVGLDDTGRSKPDPAAFALALARLGLEPASVISVGDREDVDIVPALGLGMGAILVDSVDEVRILPAFLGNGYFV